MRNKPLENKSQLTPLYLGITGHRDIIDSNTEILKQMVIDFIKKKQIQCPNTPIVLLTPLAEGADRIAAEAAINCEIDFIAVLPMPVDQYRDDFTNPESVEKFNYLLKKASSTIEISLQKGINKVNLKDIEKRNEQYYQNGLFIARQCYTLIALWDGTDNGKKGGTADVVRLKNSGIPGRIDDKTKRLSHLQTGPIYHIITPRKGNILPEKPLTIKRYYPPYFGTNDDLASKKDEEMLTQINSYNKDINKYGITLKDKIDKSANRLFGQHPENESSEMLKEIAKKHAISGELSNIFQRRRFISLRVLFLLIVLAFLFLQIYAGFYHKPLMLLLYPLTMGVGAIWFLIANKKHYEIKHEDYRALSEAYRIQFYMKACGIKENISDHYLKRHRGKLEWVIYVLRTSHLYDYNKSHFSGIDKKMKAFSFLEKNWINDQLAYFKKSALKNNVLNKKWELRANYSFIAAIISACLLFLISIIPPSIIPYREITNTIVGSFTHIFLVLSAALHGYSEKMIFSEQSKNYQQMAELYHIASSKIKIAIEKNDNAEAKDIIKELAHEALLENGDWLLLHRSRPLEIPKG